MDTPPDYKYWAFISYSHQDNLLTRGDGSTDHIQWANRLHRALKCSIAPPITWAAPTGAAGPSRFPLPHHPR